MKKLFDSQNIQVLAEFLNEVVLITGIKHRNLVQLRGCSVKGNQRILVYEYAENGNLAEAIWGSTPNGGLDWSKRFNICVGVARGLAYLHEELQPSLIHRDIKPQNILLDKTFSPKIADFGLARQLSVNETTQAQYTQVAGTLGYFSPEYATQGQVSEKTDVYSYGVLILEVVTGRKCIDHSRPLEEKFLKNWVSTMSTRGLLLDVLQPELKGSCDVEEVIQTINIALLCVQYQPEMRPKMSEVVTMFLGNIIVDAPPDDVNKGMSDYLTKLEEILEQHAERPGMQVIEKESGIIPLLDPDS